MSLLARFLNIRPPSADWHEDPHRPLELDLSAGTLSGVGLGADMNIVSFLGVAEDDRLAHQGTLVYFRKGLVVSIRAAKVAGYTAVFEPPGEGDPEHVRPFAGVILLAGRALELGEATTEAEVLARFGEPQARADYPEGSELTYERGDTVIDVKLNPAGRLASLYLGLA